MATSKCGKCEATRFEVVTYGPSSSNFKINLVQCASCGAVVGALEYYNVGVLVKKLAEKLGFDIA